MAGVGGLGGLKFGRDAFREPRHVGASERGNRNLLLGAVNRHRFQPRLLDEGGGDGTRETTPCLVAGDFCFRR